MTVPAVDRATGETAGLPADTSDGTAMGILDRFKPQPRWKHGDPAVRVAGVDEIPEDEQDLLATIARSDEDPRVRRVAVRKLGTVSVLRDVLREDADEGVREEASGVLLDIALGAYEAQEDASLAALDALAALPPADAQKQLVLVAKTARVERVSQAALDRLGDQQKALGTVARRAEHASVRLAALERLADDGEIVSTALRSSFRDAAVGALERVTDRNAYKVIATRAVNPAAARRARALVRAVEEEEAAAALAESARQHAAEIQRRGFREMCREIEALADPATWEPVPGRLAALESRWAAEAADADPELQDRFRAAVAAVHEGLARFEAEREEAAQQAQAREAEIARRRAVIARLDQLGPDATPEEAAAIEAEWAALPPLDPPAGRDLAARFDQARRGLERRRRQAADARDRRARLEGLATAIEALVADERFPGTRDLRQRRRRLRQDWQESVAGLDADPDVAPLVARVEAAEAALLSREEAHRSAREAQADADRRRAEQTLQRLTDLLKAESPTLKSMDRAIAEALAVEKALEHATRDAAQDDLLARLQAARQELQPKAQALREADDWQRWANAGVQEQLIARMEALAAAGDPQTAFRQMRELQNEWKAVASAPRDRAEALWNRFRAATDAVRTRVEPVRAEHLAQQKEHLAKKIALCEQAEALADSTDWIATADALKTLQAEWKTVGPAPRRDEQGVWERFRTACNRFFTRRQTDLKERKAVWSANLEKKEALCARAEALAESSDWEAALAELKGLQAEWKTIGPVKKSRSEQVWQRFRGACDRFFERYRTRDLQAYADRTAEREALIRQAEELGAQPTGEEARGQLLERIRSLRTGWQQAGSMPREVLRPLQARFDEAVAAVIAAAPEQFRHTELDVEANTRQLVALCERVERAAAPRPAPAESSVTVLAHQLREALAANTIGGRMDDDAHSKSGEHDVRTAQEAWRRVGFVPESVAAPLAARFQRAAQRVLGHHRRPGGPPRGAGRGEGRRA